MPFLTLDGDDARLELGWQLIGEPHRPPRPVAESLKPVLFVPVEDLVSGFAGNAEVPTHLGHRFAVQQAATNRRRSSITELSFHGIHTLRKKAESVTHVSGTECHLCLGPLTYA